MLNTNNTICWLITNKCNRNCSFCISKSSPHFEIKDYAKQIEIIKRLKDLGANKISISGGEPFVVKNLKDVAEFLIEIDMKFQITTNSDFFLKKGIPKWILDYNIPIILSLYGSEDEHNYEMGKSHFKNVLNISEKFTRKQISLNIIETKESIKFIKENIKFLMNRFSRVLLIRKMNSSELIDYNNFEVINSMFGACVTKQNFQFFFHNYDNNDIFPVINDIGEITFTSNNKTQNVGSIFSSEITYNEKIYGVSDFLHMLWNKQYTSQKMKTEIYE